MKSALWTEFEPVGTSHDLVLEHHPKCLKCRSQRVGLEPFPVFVPASCGPLYAIGTDLIASGGIEHDEVDVAPPHSLPHPLGNIEVGQGRIDHVVLPRACYTLVMNTADLKAFVRLLLPTRGLSPGALAVNMVWYVAICLAVAYLAFLPLTILPEVDLGGITALYIGAVEGSMTALFASLAAGWIFYSYIFSLAVPIARPIGQGQSLSIMLTFAGDWLLQTLWRLFSAWLTGIRCASWQFPTPRFDISLLWTQVRPGLAHLTTGWSAGTHPQVVYAPRAL